MDTNVKTLRILGDEIVRKTPWPTYDKGNVEVDHEDADAASRAVSSRRLFRYGTHELRETEVGKFENIVAGRTR